MTGRFSYLSSIGLCIGAGLAAAAYAIALTQSDPRTAAVGWVALIGGVGLLCLGSPRRISLALVVILASTLPIYIGKFFFVYLRAPDQYVEHVANVGIQFSISVLAAVAILVVQFVFAPSQRIVTGFRIEPLTASGAGLCFAAGVLSLLNAQDPTLVCFELLRLVFLYLLTFVIANLNRRAMTFFFGALAVTVLLQGLLAMGQYGVGGSLGLTVLGELPTRPERIDFVDIVRPSGTLGNANALGGFFALTLPLLLGLFLTDERRWTRLLYVAAFAAGLGGMVVTLSRGAWITLPLTLMMVVLVVVGRRIVSLKAAAIAAAGAIAAVCVGIAVGPLIATRLTGDDAGSALSRIPMIKATWSMIEQFPLFGAGLNNFTDALVRHDQTGFVQAHLAGIENSLYVHNLYVLVWAETGIVGLLALFWYVGSAWVIAFGVVRRSARPLDRAVAVGAAMGLFAQMVQGLFDIGFRVPLGPGETLIAAQIGLLAWLLLQRDKADVPTLDLSHASRERPVGLARGSIIGAGLLALLSLLPPVNAVQAATLTVGPSEAYPSLYRVPWRDLQPGDEVVIQSGVVHDGSVTISARGRAGAPIVVTAAAGGPSPIIHGTLMFAHSAHIVLENLIVENAKDVGIGIVQGSEDITVRKMVLRRNGMGVWIAMGAGGSHHVIDNEISENGTHGIGIDKIANKPGEETVLAGNRIFANGHHGINVTGSRFIVEDNVIYDNGRTQFGTSGIMLYAGGFRGAPRLDGMGSHNIVRYNTIFRQQDSQTWDGNGIEADLWANDNEISYNICYDNDGAGIIIFGAARNRIFNNTLIGNFRDSGKTHLPGGELGIATGDPPHGDAVAAGNVARNNILVSTRGKAHAIFIDRSAALNGTELGGNLLFKRGDGKLFFWAGETGEDIGRWNKLAKGQPADVNADPLFANFDDPPDGLRLRPESPGARLGEPLGLKRDRAGTLLSPNRPPSVGAFEVAR